jgi:hypothetical protein
MLWTNHLSVKVSVRGTSFTFRKNEAATGGLICTATAGMRYPLDYSIHFIFNQDFLQLSYNRGFRQLY